MRLSGVLVEQIVDGFTLDAVRHATIAMWQCNRI
jgi:hypothetical protein